MNENINLCELLKGHEGESFYSPLYGIVKFNKILDNMAYPIEVITDGNICQVFNQFGRFALGYEGSECMLFPSKDQRDWNKYKEEQESKIPKTWDNFVKMSKNSLPIRELIDCIQDGYCYHNSSYKSVLAILKINLLIEVGYGGNITEEEWKVPNYKFSVLVKRSKIEIDEFVKRKHYITFHTAKQREEFLSYPENIQLIKDFYMI